MCEVNEEKDGKSVNFVSSSLKRHSGKWMAKSIRRQDTVKGKSSDESGDGASGADVAVNVEDCDASEKKSEAT